MEGKGLKSSEKIGKSSPENFFEFVNEDIEPLSESKFIGLLHTYTRFVCQYESKYPFLQFREKYDEYTDGLLPVTSRETLLDRKEFFLALQSHLRSKLQAIIDAAESDALQEPGPFINMAGTREVLVDHTDDSFSERFSPDGLKSGHGLDLDNEKILADLIFSEIILDGNLKPSRFRRCRRCKSFFYQYTEKEKTYCSIRCGNADRQARHVQTTGQKDKKRRKKTRKASK